MMKKFSHAAVALGLLSVPAAAHVTLEQQEAVPGSYYKAVLRIPHGCAGAATLAVRVRIPEGLVGVKPMPKAGWILETVRGPYSRAYKLQHGEAKNGVKEVIWRGGNLPDEWYEEFVFQSFIATDLPPGSAVYFPTVQECENATERWIEIPEAGRSPSSYRYPAPALRLAPPKAP